MRNEQEFKALVMQKVRVQQHQKQQRLQKIRAATATMSAVALVICGVATVTLFIRANPTVDFGAQDGPYGGNKGNWFFSLFYRGSVDDEYGSWGNSAAIGNGDSSYNTDTGEGNTAEDAVTDSQEGELNNGNSQSTANDDGTASADKPKDHPPTESVDKAESENNSQSLNSSENCGMPEEEPNAGGDSNGSVQTETSSPILRLEEIHPEMADELALTAGKLEGDAAVTPIVEELSTILEDEARQVDKTDGVTLFILRRSNVSYRFCEGNLLIVSDGDTDTGYAIKSSAYLRLLRLLQETEFIPQ